MAVPSTIASANVRSEPSASAGLAVRSAVIERGRGLEQPSFGATGRCADQRKPEVAANVYARTRDSSVMVSTGVRRHRPHISAFAQPAVACWRVPKGTRRVVAAEMSCGLAGQQAESAPGQTGSQLSFRWCRHPAMGAETIH